MRNPHENPDIPPNWDFSTFLSELRTLARAYLRRERPGHTLQPTALVNELWLRMSANSPPTHKTKEEFFAAAANAMRQILVDHARTRNAAKRTPPDPDLTRPLAPQYEDMLLLDRALEGLAALDPRQARIVELRFLCGCSVEETAAILQLSTKTIQREWITAKAWLRREINR